VNALNLTEREWLHCDAEKPCQETPRASRNNWVKFRQAGKIASPRNLATDADTVHSQHPKRLELGRVASHMPAHLGFLESVCIQLDHHQVACDNLLSQRGEGRGLGFFSHSAFVMS
jgi:hypothetical protein